MPTFAHAGADIYYELAGEAGPPVLLLTGFAVGGGVWEHQVAALAPDHRVACLDNRGAGRTRAKTSPWTIRDMAQDALALLDHLGWDRAHVCGASMGGMIAQEVALAARDRLLSLTLIATHAGRPADKQPRWHTLSGFLRSNIGSKDARREAIEALLFSADYLATAPREPIDRALERDFLVQPPLPDRLAQLGAILRHDTARRLPTLAGLPTLIIVADEDRLLPPSGCAALGALIPGAEVVHLPAGHGVIGERKEAVNAALRAHLGRIP